MTRNSMRPMRRFCLRVVVAAGLTGCAPKEAPAPDPQLVAQWMRTSLAVVRTERLGAPVASRISAYAALALYEGYAADTRSALRSLSGQLNGLAPMPGPDGDEPVDGATVAATAERVVLDSLLRDATPGTRRTVDSLAVAQVAHRVAQGVDSARSARSVSHGQRIGAALLAWAAVDSFYATRGRPWAPSGKRSEWQNTAEATQFIPQTMSGQSDLVVLDNPNVRQDLERETAKGTFTNRPKADGPTTLPAFNPLKPTEPYWGHLRPFVMPTADACAPPPPPAYSEEQGSAFRRMGEQFYDSVRALSASQKQIALFWADNPVATGTPGFHWISVANQMVTRRALNADAAVELYALTSLAIADAFIGCWAEKYRSNVVRPVAYVRRTIDPNYQTVIPTPPFPEYPSGHSVQSGAAVHILITLLGDTIPYADSTQMDIGQPARQFANFTAARTEVAMSRVYAGVHYMPAVTDGLTQGECIGKRVGALVTRRGS